MTDGHGVSSTPNSDAFRQLLEALDGDPPPSQRTLARRLGVSLGCVNQLVRRLIAQEWIRAVPLGAHRMRYVITEEGMRARDRLVREHLVNALASYGAVRDQIRRRLADCAREIDGGDGTPPPAVVLYGLGDVAQIAFACAADLGVQLLGFADETPRDTFLGLPVRAPRDLAEMALDGRAFDRLLVASLASPETIRGRLEEAGFPLERVSWL